MWRRTSKAGDRRIYFTGTRSNVHAKERPRILSFASRGSETDEHRRSRSATLLR